MWYGEGIVGYLENIGFVADMEKIKLIVDNYYKQMLKIKF
jgi:hypothetical protein